MRRDRLPTRHPDEDEDEDDATPASGVRLTRRGWTLAGAAGALVLGSRVLGAGPLAGLGLGAGILLLGAGAWVFAARPGLDLRRSVLPARLHVGTEGRVVLEGTTTTATPVLGLSDRVDSGRRVARFVLPPQAADTPVRAVYRVPTDRRGRHVVGPLLATVTDPLGLAHRRLVVAETADIIVCPRIHAVVAPRRGGGGEPAAHVDGARAPALEPLGEFLAMREYEPGDDPRRVHWPSSAKRGDLVVRQDEAASPGRVVLVLDTRPALHDDTSFEAAVEGIASLAVSLRRVHAPVEVVTTGGEFLGRPGPGGIEVLLERLAVVERDDTEHLGAVVAALRDRLGIGAVVAVTGDVDRAAVEALRLVRARCLVTVVATRSTGPFGPATGLTLIDASGGFAPAWNIFTSRLVRRWNATTSPSFSHSAR